MTRRRKVQSVDFRPRGFAKGELAFIAAVRRAEKEGKRLTMKELKELRTKLELAERSR
jgi:hypothetical protein